MIPRSAIAQLPTALASVALLYALGVLVSNLYFAQFDFFQFALLKPRYVATGTCLALLLAAPFLVGWVTSDRVGLRSIEGGWRDALWILVTSFFTIAVGGIVGVVVAWLLHSTFMTESLEIELLAFFIWQAAAALVGVTTGVIVRSGLHDRAFEAVRQRPVRPEGLHGLVRIAAAVLFILGSGWSIALFVREIYPAIPAGLGGGRPIFVNVVMSGSAGSYLERELSETQGVTEARVVLHDESDGSFIFGIERVQPPPRRTVALLVVKREQVEVMRAAPRPRLAGQR